MKRWLCEDLPPILAVLRKCRDYPEARAALPGVNLDSIRSVFQRHRQCCGTKPPGYYFGTAQLMTPKPLAKCKTSDSILLVPDVHVPYHDRGAWALLLAVARHLQPAHVVVLGDFADCYSVSFHDKSPRRISKLADELEAVSECLRELEAATPCAARIYVEGNHEARMSRYISRQAGALHGIVGTTYPEIVELPAHGWHWVPYHQAWAIGDLHVTHDVGRAGVYAARQSRMAFGSSIAIGHVHRMAIEHERTVDGRHHLGASFGWLGDAEAVDYRHRSLARREWVHGCGIATLDDQGHVHVQAVPFVGGRAWVAGSIVAA
jgi:hypothetical protein